MDKIFVQTYIINKVTEFLRKRILHQEVINKSAAGIDKLQAVLDDNFWDKAEEFIIKSKEKDNKFIPNFLELFIEDIFYSVFLSIRQSLNLRDLLEQIVAEEKLELYKGE